MTSNLGARLLLLLCDLRVILRREPARLFGVTHGALIVQSLSRRTRFRCAALKVAMIKNQHLAESLFGGNVYDCVCLFEPGG